MELIETGEVRHKDERRLWIAKCIPSRTDNLLCAAVTVEDALIGHLEKLSRADRAQGAPQRIPETYQEDRRGVSEEVTLQSVRAVGFSRCPIVKTVMHHVAWEPEE
ncbi:MAG: hypothetical protein AB1344_07635 [Pseudomonadota bacterium]